jgi:hypothetical protein
VVSTAERFNIEESGGLHEKQGEQLGSGESSQHLLGTREKTT